MGEYLHCVHESLGLRKDENAYFIRTSFTGNPATLFRVDRLFGSTNRDGHLDRVCCVPASQRLYLYGSSDVPDTGSEIHARTSSSIV
jgi:hypothetical protein